MKLNKSVVRRQFFDLFSDEELEKLYSLVFSRCREKKPDQKIRMSLECFSFEEFFGLIHLKLFGRYRSRDGCVLAVFEKISDLKEILKMVEISSPVPPKRLIAHRSDCGKGAVKMIDERIPDLPEKLSLYRPDCGKVFVTKHAWKRFWERFLSKKTTIDRAVKILKKSFERAIVTKLDPKNSVLRLINNNFVPTLYLLDALLNIRFIVCEKTRTLLTVEIPCPP